MKRRIALDIETSTDGERCDPGCPHVGMYGDFCRAFNASTRDVRHPACIEAEREAQVAAMEAEIDGFEHAATYPDHSYDEAAEALSGLRMALAALKGGF